MEIFNMTMTNKPLPFPVKRARVEAQHMEDEVAEDAELIRGAPMPSSRRPSDVYGYAGEDGEMDADVSGRKGAEEVYEYGDAPVFDADIDLDQQYPPEDEVDFGARVGLSPSAERLPLGALAIADKKPTSEEERKGEEEAASGAIGTWNARTAKVFEVLQEQLREKDLLTFRDISAGISRRTAAGSFLEILQLKTWGYIDTTQDEPFGDITLAATSKMWEIAV